MLLFLCAHSLVCSDFVILLYCDVFINLLTKLLSCVMCVCMCVMCEYDTDTHTRLRALFPELPGCAGTRKVKPIWILLKQETVSGSGISWPICKSASRSRQITMPVPHHWGFFIGRMPLLPPNQQRQSTEGVVNVTHLTYFYYDLLYCHTVHFY